MVFLCQPNNPTGQLTALPLVEQILRRCAACGTAAGGGRMLPRFPARRMTAGHGKRLCWREGNLVILKAFTKLYGMAGVRLGYCPECRRQRCWNRCRPAGQPWARVQSGAGGGPRRAGGDSVCGRGPGPHRRAAAPPDGRACGRWACGCWTAGQITCCFRPRRRWEKPLRQRSAVRLRELPRAGPRLVPHRRAHRA